MSSNISIMAKFHGVSVASTIRKIYYASRRQVLDFVMVLIPRAAGVQ